MGNTFRFQQFSIRQELCAMKVGTDGVLLGAWARGGSRILDIGCGTGVVSLMLAQRYPDAHVTAIDIVPDCCREARDNAEASPFAARVTVVNAPLQECLKEASFRQAFDAIVSNPPYYDGSLKPAETGRAMARHADTLPFCVLAKGVAQLLSGDGTFSVIVPDSRAKQLVDECWFAGLHLCEDISVRPKAAKPVSRRLLRFASRRESMPAEHTVVLQNEDGTRSPWYSALTRDFFL